MYRQRTISNPVEMTGTKVFLQFPWQKRDSNVRFEPAEANNGIVFYYKGKKIPATFENAYTPMKLRSSFASCVGLKKGLTSIIKVEHILAHLYAMGIDNLDIHLEHRSVPRFDGAGKELFEKLEGLVVEQDSQRKLWKVNSYLPIKHENAEMPDRVEFMRGSEGKTTISYLASFPHKAVGKQMFQIDFNDIEEYKDEVMAARGIFFMPFTKFVGNEGSEKFRRYLFDRNIHGINSENSLLIGEKETEEPLNVNDFGKEEFVRHKIQDGLAQLALAQKRIVQGSINYHMTSHQFDLNAWRAAIGMGIFERVD